MIRAPTERQAESLGQALMSTSDFMGADRPCIQCQHFGGWRGPTQSAAWCLDGKIVQANAEHGCAFWAKANDETSVQRLNQPSVDHQ